MASSKGYFGVVEGFYGRPYTDDERRELILFLSRIGLNTYVYAPKSDPFHRRNYGAHYSGRALKRFTALNELAARHKVIFSYALSPGTRPDTGKIIAKIRQVGQAGIIHYSLLYDDIKVERSLETAEKQAETANRLFKILRRFQKQATLFFCPTQYAGFNATDYLLTIGQNLHRDIEIFWTGKKVVSKRITEKQVGRIAALLGRPPLIWDNLFANDYQPGTILRFPYRGRDPAIIGKVRGILINPMNEFSESLPLIQTAAEFIKNPRDYRPAVAWQNANNHKKHRKRDISKMYRK